MRRWAVPADGGWSLVETMVSMALMSIAGTIFTAGFVQIYGTFDATQEQSAAQQQLTTAFLRLDREVQYAGALSLPAQVGNDWYAEYLTGVGDVHTCVELRLNAAARQLQRRTWINGTTIAPTPWVPLASDVTAVVAGAGPTVAPSAGPAAAPFELLHADEAVNFHRLRVTMASAAGRQSETIWPAWNAGINPVDDICTGARGIP